MKDFSFDELDQAVGSLLETQKSAEDTTPVKSDPAPASPATNDKPLTQRTPRRGGRFMDIVHPSSDAKKPAPMAARTSKTMQPLNPQTTPEIPESKPEVSSPEPMAEPTIDSIEASSSDTSESDVISEETTLPETEESITSSAESTSSEHKWPDPLELAQADDSSDVAPEEPADDKAEATQEDADATVQEAETDYQPDLAKDPASLFNDAKVEKRPLGAFADTSDATPNTESETNTDESKEPEPVEQPAHMKEVDSPPEFDKDVLAAETKAYGSEEAVAPVSANLTVGATGSISKQYKELPEHSGDVVPHPIFDTKDYHPALPNPVHHGHAGWWIATAVIILVSTMAGFAYWFFIATK